MSAPNKEQLRNVLKLARQDPLVRQYEILYRSPSVEDGPLCLAVVLMQGAERYGIPFDMDMMAEVIAESWAEA